MAVDYREVNQFLKVSANQLPYQDMLLQQLGGQAYYAKVDNLWGYHQLKLDPQSSRVTAIITPWGVHRFVSCPFGISTAPGKYQARMAHQVLEGYYLNGVVVYIDDTVIYGKTRKFSWKCWIWSWGEWSNSMSVSSPASVFSG